MNKKRIIAGLCICATLAAVYACKVSYSFSGASIAPEVKTVSIQQFQNLATLVVPVLSSQLTEALQDKFSRQTRLTLVREDGDFSFEGDITNYTSTPIAVTGDEYASMNRLTITVKVNFVNKIQPEYNFSRQFSAYEDYDSNQLMQEVEPTLLPQIIEKLVDDIFNQAVSNW